MKKTSKSLNSKKIWNKYKASFKKKEIVNVIELALKTPKINKVNIKKKNLKAHYKTRYEKLKENKGSEF